MCLAIPGKIVEIKEGGDCVVDYGAEKRSAKILGEGFSIGDFVIVSNKVVITKVDEEKAMDYLNAIKDSGYVRKNGE